MKNTKPKPYALILKEKPEKWQLLLTEEGLTIAISIRPVFGASFNQVTVYPWKSTNGWLRLQWLKLRVVFNCL